MLLSGGSSFVQRSTLNLSGCKFLNAFKPKEDVYKPASEGDLTQIGEERNRSVDENFLEYGSTFSVLSAVGPGAFRIPQMGTATSHLLITVTLPPYVPLSDEEIEEVMVANRPTMRPEDAAIGEHHLVSEAFADARGNFVTACASIARAFNEFGASNASFTASAIGILGSSDAASSVGSAGAIRPITQNDVMELEDEDLMNLFSLYESPSDDVVETIDIVRLGILTEEDSTPVEIVKAMRKLVTFRRVIDEATHVLQRSLWRPTASLTRILTTASPFRDAKTSIMGLTSVASFKGAAAKVQEDGNLPNGDKKHGYKGTYRPKLIAALADDAPAAAFVANIESAYLDFYMATADLGIKTEDRDASLLPLWVLDGKEHAAMLADAAYYAFALMQTAKIDSPGVTDKVCAAYGGSRAWCLHNNLHRDSKEIRLIEVADKVALPLTFSLPRCAAVNAVCAERLASKVYVVGSLFSYLKSGHHGTASGLPELLMKLFNALMSDSTPTAAEVLTIAPYASYHGPHFASTRLLNLLMIWTMSKGDVSLAISKRMTSVIPGAAALTSLEIFLGALQDAGFFRLLDKDREVTAFRQHYASWNVEGWKQAPYARYMYGVTSLPDQALADKAAKLYAYAASIQSVMPASTLRYSTALAREAAAAANNDIIGPIAVNAFASGVQSFYTNKTKKAMDAGRKSIL